MKPQIVYARILGAAPQRAKLGNGVIANLWEFVEAFGPPETRGANGDRTLFWNFSPNREARKYFTCSCRVPARVTLTGKLTVDVSTNGYGRKVDHFFAWFTEKHMAVLNEVEAPQFLVGNGPVCIIDRPTFPAV